MALTFEYAWAALIIGYFLFWLVLYKLDKDKAIKKDLICGVITLVIAFLVEQFGVGNNLWNYTKGNWPWQLWPVYFLVGLSGYRLIRLIDKKWRR